MRVIDLTEEHKSLIAACLEDWSPESKEAGPRRARWMDRFLDRGLRGKFAIDDDGVVGGMIQYLPLGKRVRKRTGCPSMSRSHA